MRTFSSRSSRPSPKYLIWLATHAGKVESLPAATHIVGLLPSQSVSATPKLVNLNAANLDSSSYECVWAHAGMAATARANTASRRRFVFIPNMIDGRWPKSSSFLGYLSRIQIASPPPKADGLAMTVLYRVSLAVGSLSGGGAAQAQGRRVTRGGATPSLSRPPSRPPQGERVQGVRESFLQTLKRCPHDGRWQFHSDVLG